MIELLTDFARIFLGVSFGTLGIFFAVVTWRTFHTGREAFQVNRASTPASLWLTVRGASADVDDTQKRNSHGLAVDLRSKKLIAQQRLSREAVDDVIGRRF